jgi:hypothetical protein
MIIFVGLSQLMNWISQFVIPLNGFFLYVELKVPTTGPHILHGKLVSLA